MGETLAINARQVDQIRHGAKPGGLPVEQPTHFDYVLSRSTLEKLGLTPAAGVLARVTLWLD